MLHVFSLPDKSVKSFILKLRVRPINRLQSRPPLLFSSLLIQVAEFGADNIFELVTLIQDILRGAGCHVYNMFKESFSSRFCVRYKRRGCVCARQPGKQIKSKMSRAH